MRPTIGMTGIDGRERAASPMPAPRFHLWARRVAIGLIGFHACLWPWELYRGELNRMNVYDVRTYRYTHTVMLTSDVLAGFEPGPASVELTGYGRMKLLRTPAPVVRQQRVMVLTTEPPPALSQRLPAR